MAFVAAFLAACGGGGGGNGTPTPKLSVSPTVLTFLANGTADATPAPQTVTGTASDLTSGGTLYVTIVGSGAAIAGISAVTITSNSSGQSTVSVPAPATLGIGTYTGTINVSACLNDSTCSTGALAGSPQTVDVTYNVAGVKASVTSLGYAIDNTPLATDLTGQFTVTTFPSQTWTASTTTPWLSVTSSGSSGDVLTANLVQSALTNLHNGVYAGTIHLVPATNGQPLDVTISLTVRRTQIDYVSPYVAYRGTSANVIIRGEEFLQLSGSTAIQTVLFGTTPAVSYHVVSNTEIDATYPATLADGSYRVGLQSTYTGTVLLASLAVVDAPAFTATVLPYPDTDSKYVSAMIFDAERAALGVSVWYNLTGATSVMRYANIANVWQSPSPSPLINNFALAIAADGSAWMAGSGVSIATLDPVSLATRTTIAGPIPDVEDIFNMAVASNGTIATTAYMYSGASTLLAVYDVRQQTFSTPSSTASRLRVGASGDGSRVLVVNQFISPGTDDVFALDSVSGTLSATGIHLLSGFAPVLDRAGDRILISNVQTNVWQVYDGSYTLLGSLPGTPLAVVASPDGRRAYGYDQSGLLLTYDLTATPMGATFPEIGTGITLAGSPGNIGTPSINGTLFAMAMTPDGATVFVAGGSAVVVQPVP